jgi:hypothetical protein
MNDLRERVARAIAEEYLRSPVHRVFDAGELAAAAIAATKLQREVFVLRDGELVSEMEPVPATSKGQPCCTLCETPLDQPGRPWTRSCGGDCLACMADVGDPDCVTAMAAIDAGVGAVPEGWRLVPVEPTLEMIEVGAKAIWGGALSFRGDASVSWRAMVDAAPTPPAPPETGEAETAPANTEKHDA